MTVTIGPIEFEEEWLYKQLRRDLHDDWFPDPRFFCDMIDSGLLATLVNTNFEAYQGRYRPSGRSLFNLPKPNFTLRYALEMGLADRLLYQGAVAHLLPFYDPCIHWSVFSHRYDPFGSRENSLFKPLVESWKNFRGGVKAALTPGSVLITTDLSNYYEHINIEKLAITFYELLPELSASATEKSRVRDCLERLFEWLKEWCYNPERGLPQNRDASSFLANIYMVPVDRVMIATGCAYFRYMDDIKIVCPDLVTARRAMKTLIIALRERGLSLNTGKTSILAAEDRDVAGYLSELSPQIQALDVAWNTRSRWPILRSLDKLREITVSLLASGKSHEGGFRFCLKRLIWLAGCDDMALPPEFFEPITDEIIGNLASAPATTSEFVDYLSVVYLSPIDLARLAAYLADPASRVYSWQDYRLWLVLLRRGIRDERLIAAALALVALGEDTASRAGATLYLGRFGTLQEKEVAAMNFGSLTSFLGQRSALIGCHELPYQNVIRDHVKPHVRSDLKDVYKNLQQSKGVYFSRIEPQPVTKFVDSGHDHAS